MCWHYRYHTNGNLGIWTGKWKHGSTALDYRSMEPKNMVQPPGHFLGPDFGSPLLLFSMVHQFSRPSEHSKFQWHKSKCHRTQMSKSKAPNHLIYNKGKLTIATPVYTELGGAMCCWWDLQTHHISCCPFEKGTVWSCSSLLVVLVYGGDEGWLGYGDRILNQQTKLNWFNRTYDLLLGLGGPNGWFSPVNTHGSIFDSLD